MAIVTTITPALQAVAGAAAGAAAPAQATLTNHLAQGGRFGVLSRASIGADPSAITRSLDARVHLAKPGKTDLVQNRVSFLALLLLGKKKTAEYKYREHSSGFLVSGGRGRSTTMNVGVPAERAVALSGGWETLGLSEKKKDMGSLLRNQINAHDFTSHKAEKTTLLQRALSRLLSSSPTAAKLRIITLLLGNDPKEALKAKFESLSKPDKVKILNNVKKRLGKAQIKKLEKEITELHKSGGRATNKLTPADLLSKIKAEDFLPENTILEKLFVEPCTIESFEQLYNPKGFHIVMPEDAEILNNLSEAITIDDLAPKNGLETLLAALTPEEKASLEESYFVNTCFETLRAVNGNRSWLKHSVYGGVITAGATLILNAISVKGALITLGALAGLSTIALAAAAPYIIPVVIAIGLALIVTGILLQRRDARETTLKQDRDALDALLKMNEECAKEIARLEADGDQKVEDLKALLLTPKQITGHLKEILEELKLEHKQQGSGKMLRLKRAFLGDHLNLRIKQMERLLNPEVKKLRREMGAVLKSEKEIKTATKYAKKVVKDLIPDKKERKATLKALSTIEKSLRKIDLSFWRSSKKTKKLEEKAESLIANIETQRDALKALLTPLRAAPKKFDILVPLETHANEAKVEALQKALKEQLEALEEITKAIALVKAEAALEATDVAAAEEAHPSIVRAKDRAAFYKEQKGLARALEFEAALKAAKTPTSPGSERESSFGSLPSTTDLAPVSPTLSDAEREAAAVGLTLVLPGSSR